VVQKNRRGHPISEDANAQPLICLCHRLLQDDRPTTCTSIEDATNIFHRDERDVDVVWCYFKERGEALHVKNSAAALHEQDGSCSASSSSSSLAPPLLKPATTKTHPNCSCSVAQV